MSQSKSPKPSVNPARRRRRRVAIALVAGLVAGAGGGVAVATFSGLPAIQGLESYEPTAATQIYDRNGDEIAAIFVERRIPVAIDQVPEQLRQAVVAVEDESFYQHHGVDVAGIARAMLSNLRRGRAAQGGSTITQQLAKNLFLTPDKTLRRKLKEAYIAFQIERRYTKDQILGLYLNQIYLGNGAFGVEAASQIYFGKSVSELDLNQCALLAGLPKAPSYYDPIAHPERARTRRNVVMLRLRDAGVITQSEFQRLKELPLDLDPKERRSNAAPYFVDYLLPQLEKRFGEQRVWRGGLQVYTTLDLKVQEAAEEALAQGLKVTRARQTAYEKRRGRKVKEPLQGAVLSIDPTSGDILAMVGGSDYGTTQFNRTVQAKRQPGSTFKPIIYSAAISSGYTQSDPLWDAPLRYPNRATGKVWTPKNWYRDYLGKIPLRIAMEQSSNCASVYLLERVGLPTAIQTARAMGITTPLQPNLTLALGASDVTVMDLTRAYAALANGGVSTEPRAILQVLERKGGLIWEAPPNPGKPALRPEVAYVMTDMLHGYTVTGLAAKAGNRLDFQVAGKTGTTDNSYDAWFVGFSSRMVSTVWMGIDSHKPMRFGMSGSSGPLPVWIDFMEAAGKRMVPADFEAPPGITTVEVDRRTGKLASSSCPDMEPDTWAFIEGTEPTESCEDVATSALPFGFHLETEQRFQP